MQRYYKQECIYIFQSGFHESSWRFGLVLTLYIVWTIKYNYIYIYIYIYNNNNSNNNNNIIALYLFSFFNKINKLIKCNNIIIILK